MKIKRKEYFIQIETGKQLINLINYKNSGRNIKSMVWYAEKIVVFLLFSAKNGKLFNF